MGIQRKRLQEQMIASSAVVRHFEMKCESLSALETTNMTFRQFLKKTFERETESWPH